MAASGAISPSTSPVEGDDLRLLFSDFASLSVIDCAAAFTAPATAAAAIVSSTWPAVAATPSTIRAGVVFFDFAPADFGFVLVADSGFSAVFLPFAALRFGFA